jgi:hypothetical protein
MTPTALWFRRSRLAQLATCSTTHPAVSSCARSAQPPGAGGALGAGRERANLADAIHDRRQFRQLGLPVIDTTGRTPMAVFAELARFIQSSYQSEGPAHIW